MPLIYAREDDEIVLDISYEEPKGTPNKSLMGDAGDAFMRNFHERQVTIRKPMDRAHAHAWSKVNMHTDYNPFQGEQDGPETQA